MDSGLTTLIGIGLVILVICAVVIIWGTSKNKTRDLVRKMTTQKQDNQIHNSESQNSQTQPATLSPSPPLTAPPALINPQGMVYEIRISQKSKWNAERAVRFIEQIMDLMGGTVAFQIVADSQHVVWRLVDYRVEHYVTTMVISNIQMLFPDAEVIAKPYNEPQFTTSFTRWMQPLMGSNKQIGWPAPFRYADTIKDIDPLAAIVQAMGNGLHEGTTLTFSLVSIGMIDHKATNRGKNAITQSNIDWANVGKRVVFGGVGGALSTAAELTKMAVSGNTRTKKYVNDVQKVIEEKVYKKRVWTIYCTLQLDVGYAEDGINQINTITALTSLESPLNSFITPPQEFGKFGPKSIDSQDDLLDTDPFEFAIDMGEPANAWKRQHLQLNLCADEIASLWHLPHEGFSTKTIAWVAPGRPSKDIIENTNGAIIGKSGDDTIRLPNVSSDPLHTNIIGKSGRGKSTFMVNMIHDDIQAGRGVAVIDPHGTLVDEILRRSIPDNRIDDVVLIDIANTTYPPPLNVLTLPDESGQIGIGQIMAIFEKVYEDFRAPRAMGAFERCLYTLRYQTQPTPRDVAELFNDQDFRLKYLRKFGSKLDPASQKFWKRYNDLSLHEQDQMNYPIMHRIQRFFGSDELYPMLCHPDSIDWGKLMAKNAIILVSLATDEAKVPPSEKQLLGTLVVSQIEVAARRFGKGNPFDFRMYIDEAQKFVTTSLPKMFEEIRKYGVWLTIANQYLEQLRGATLASVMGNVTTTVAFEVGKDDANEVESYVRPVFTADDLKALGRYRAVIKTSLNGESQPAFLVNTAPPPPAIGDLKTQDERIAMIRERSIKNYTPKSQEEVMDWLKKRYPEVIWTMPTGDDEKAEDNEEEAEEDWGTKAP